MSLRKISGVNFNGVDLHKTALETHYGKKMTSQFLEEVKNIEKYLRKENNDDIDIVFNVDLSFVPIISNVEILNLSDGSNENNVFIPGGFFSFVCKNIAKTMIKLNYSDNNENSFKLDYYGKYTNDVLLVEVDNFDKKILEELPTGAYTATLEGCEVIFVIKAVRVFGENKRYIALFELAMKHIFEEEGIELSDYLLNAK